VKVIVTIANHGTGNDRYLLQLINEYKSMSFDVDIVVLSNIRKPVPPGVELVVVDLRGKNPCWLPFAHRQILADRLNQYDLFIYSEDDTLVQEKNLRAFLDVSAALADDEVPGFLRFEQSPAGGLSYPEVHGHFHWEPESVRSRGGYTLAFFTNEHAACYALTREQLRRAIGSGGFLVPAHSSKYDLVCTAGTDPYTQCGLQKLICISHLEQFSIHHLSNKYVETGWGLSGIELSRQVSALLRIGKNGGRPARLFDTETNLIDGWYSKDYYEPIQTAAVAAIPSHTRTVLSIGCGWGATEILLAKMGLFVTAVPLDPLIPGGVESKGVEIVTGSFDQALETLAGRQFDCLLLSNVLHLVPNPVEILSSFGALLSPGGVVVAVVPHTADIMTAWKTFRKRRRLIPNAAELVAGWKAIRKPGRAGNPTTYETAGFHAASPNTVRQWFQDAGMRIESFSHLHRLNTQRSGPFALGLLDPWLAREFVAVAKMVPPGPAGKNALRKAAGGVPGIPQRVR
jgi:2-polyprenyl-3-methyl-5-hydroxy-6-metoxy-1,4-benzoquinol methylase